MKAKTINYVLIKKFGNWLATIKDTKVKDLVRQNSIITGGCITSMLLNEPVNDYDIYFYDLNTATEVAKYYVNEFTNLNKGLKPQIKVIDGRVTIYVKSSGVASESQESKYNFFESVPEETGQQTDFIDGVIAITGKEATVLDVDPSNEMDDRIIEAMKSSIDSKIKEPSYRPVFLTTNAISLSNKVQLILRFYGPPEEIHKNYDFVHCTNYWDSRTKKLILNQNALESILAKDLRYVGSLYPLCSMFRTRKFISKGWSITAGQMLKIAMQISELDLSNVAILREQIIGVDVMYFFELLNALKKADPKRAIDSTYIAELIDKIF